MKSRVLAQGWVWCSLLLTLGCARPQSLRSQDVLGHIASDYRAFFPSRQDPQPGQDLGLLRPRFGLPAIVPPGQPLPIELLVRGEPSLPQLSLVAGSQAVPLRIVSQQREPLSHGASRLVLQVVPTADLAAQSYDLQLVSASDAPVRAPRAVWIRHLPDGPGARPLRVAQLSDIHIGKGRAQLREHLEQIIDDLNARAPDLVLVTGDIANVGGRRDLLEEARDRLLRIEAPVVVVPGNHDLGFDRKTLLGAGYARGWPAFAHVFHPHLFFGFQLAGWEFVGFDSGPSTVSMRVLTRGLSDDTVAALHEQLTFAHTQGRHGVVLFSHAPSRALLSTRSDPKGIGLFGRMRHGARAFERELLDASQRLRVLHLSGHTHWADLFEARAPQGQRPQRFHRWPARAISPCLQPISGRASLINAQSATHTTFHLRRNAQGHGYVWLELDKDAPKVAFVRYHGATQQRCPAS